MRPKTWWWWWLSCGGGGYHVPAVGFGVASFAETREHGDSVDGVCVGKGRVTQ